MQGSVYTGHLWGDLRGRWRIKWEGHFVLYILSWHLNFEPCEGITFLMKRGKGENSISWAKSCHCYKGNLKKIFLWGLPWHPMVKTSPSNAGVWVCSLVWELRFPLPCGQNTKTQSRSNTVTDSIKTLKMVHIQKVFKKNFVYMSSALAAQNTCTFFYFFNEIKVIQHSGPPEMWMAPGVSLADDKGPWHIWWAAAPGPRELWHHTAGQSCLLASLQLRKPVSRFCPPLLWWPLKKSQPDMLPALCPVLHIHLCLECLPLRVSPTHHGGSIKT